MGVHAILAAGDGRAAKAGYGESKVYLEMAGRPLVERVVATLQDVPEVDEVWVVGNAERLERVFADDAVRARLRKPLHVIPQFRNLYENCWQTWRRPLPGAGPEGPDPGTHDEDRRALFLSADLPFATPHEISAFLRQALALDCDYALGLVSESAMAGFLPKAPGSPGIEMAYFNLAEGRFRQSNLHLVRPVGLGNRTYIEEMYEYRYQKEFVNILKLAWRLLRIERGGLTVLVYYGVIQLAAFCHRRGWLRLADRLRSWIPFRLVERRIGQLLRTRFRLVVTEVGGCGVDIDNEHDFDAARARYDEWWSEQWARAESLYGALPASAGPGTGPSGEGR